MRIRQLWMNIGFAWLLASCASAPKVTKESLQFFPNGADIYLQVNIPGFRSLGKDANKVFRWLPKKNLRTGLDFTGQVSLFLYDETFMLRAIGTYPKSLILGQLRKQAEGVYEEDNEIFTLSISPEISFIKKDAPWQLQIPASGTIYFSNALRYHLAQMRQVTTSQIPVRVQQALQSSKNAVIYIPDISVFQDLDNLTKPLLIPLRRILVVITPKGGKYLSEFFVFFDDDKEREQKLRAQAKFIYSNFANNKSIKHFTYEVMDDGIRFQFEIKHKSIIQLLKMRKQEPKIASI
ncbi:hypothetical protein PVA44_00570 [Entomospira nematocerorum]|uniref:DUF4292 domain-containing protein n=1 Tax=Entomospira nematocerorum TaxID=2719987 RepID=A0A968GHZ1_9SPIO|nr:hypothetical protein [Entomospira nematocera]NIZ47466.1 hypothetical protein [Entomospira nematocera]WDI33994.1 hypothetical protein PVA44_00570 [Entomospira nematocera]